MKDKSEKNQIPKRLKINKEKNVFADAQQKKIDPISLLVQKKTKNLNLKFEYKELLLSNNSNSAEQKNENEKQTNQYRNVSNYYFTGKLMNYKWSIQSQMFLEKQNKFNIKCTINKLFGTKQFQLKTLHVNYNINEQKIDIKPTFHLQFGPIYFNFIPNIQDIPKNIKDLLQFNYQMKLGVKNDDDKIFFNEEFLYQHSKLSTAFHFCCKADAFSLNSQLHLPNVLNKNWKEIPNFSILLNNKLGQQLDLEYNKKSGYLAQFVQKIIPLKMDAGVQISASNLKNIFSKYLISIAKYKFLCDNLNMKLQFNQLHQICTKLEWNAEKKLKISLLYYKNLNPLKIQDNMLPLKLQVQIL